MATRTKVERWSMVTTSLPCITCVGSTTMPLGVTTPNGEVVQVTACGLQLFRRGVDFDGQGRAQGEGSFWSDVDGQGQQGSAAGRFHVARSFVAHETLTCTGKATAVGGKFT